MKKSILTTIIIILIISSGIGSVSAENINEPEEIQMNNSQTIQREDETEENQRSSTKEETDDRIGQNVTALHGGYYNVSFDDGYNGFCVNHELHSTLGGEKFTVQDTSFITSNIYQDEKVGNYLKILFVEFYNYTMNPSTNIANAIWAFTDGYYKTSTDPITMQIIEMSENGLVIKDHGEIRKINNTTEAIFDFEALDSNKGTTQNFFGYKITYRDIVEDEPVLGVPDVENNESETPEENTTEPENNTTETPQENITEPENNTTETPQENETETVSEIKENKTQNENKVSLTKHATGMAIPIVLILIFVSILIGKYRRE